MVQVFNDVFEKDEPIANVKQFEKLLTNPDFFVFVVLLNNEVIGVLTIHILHRNYGTKPIAYIHDFGIRPAL